jgi:hypothetical protein
MNLRPRSRDEWLDLQPCAATDLPTASKGMDVSLTFVSSDRDADALDLFVAMVGRSFGDNLPGEASNGRTDDPECRTADSPDSRGHAAGLRPDMREFAFFPDVLPGRVWS